MKQEKKFDYKQDIHIGTIVCVCECIENCVVDILQLMQQ